ncbi:hypothetical protein CASFOL_042497 [Castilleja foliolosa]|uniref:Uncharacterized protein n=1 Tax=Castilleja foliolosa TaxID=1961234 RepID=A0ABD3BAL0_9LAMI
MLEVGGGFYGDSMLTDLGGSGLSDLRWMVTVVGFTMARQRGAATMVRSLGSFDFRRRGRRQRVPKRRGWAGPA